MVHVLTKEDGIADLGPGVNKVRFGASWDTTAGMSGGLIGRAKKYLGTDLDAFAILMQGDAPVRFAGLDILDPVGNGSVVHSGDNQTGKGDGDDETIDLNLPNIPGHVTAAFLVVAAFKRGSSLEKAANVAFNVYTDQGGSMDQVAAIWPSLLGGGNACLVARLFRRQGESGQWDLEVVNTMGNVIQGDRNSLLRFAMR